MKANSELAWDNYKKSQQAYKKLIRTSKRTAWKTFCKETEALPVVARLRKTPNGSLTNNHRETVEHLIQTHFPGSAAEDRERRRSDNAHTDPAPADWGIAEKVINTDRVKWAIGSFKRFKSPGTDGIFPALLQEGGEGLYRRLSQIFKSCLAKGYVPKAWRYSNVVFIPKPGKNNYDLAKSYRPISLTYFLLKTLERLVDRYIRDEASKPLHPSHHAYQNGKSTETALHNLVGSIEGALSNTESALYIFLDIKGAFDNTPHDAIQEVAMRYNIKDSVVRWIHNMLTNRTVTTSLGEETVRADVARGCPQGGVLSHLLWTLVVDQLVRILTTEGFEVQGYADELTITVRGRHPLELARRLQKAIALVESWGRSHSLSVNPSKTELVLFTRRRRFYFKAPHLFGTQLQLTDENVLPHMGTQTKDGQVDIPGHPCTYYNIRLDCVVDLHEEGSTQKDSRKNLPKALLGITGALATTPTMAMGALLDIKPPHLVVMATAWRAALRLHQAQEWYPASEKEKWLEDANDILTPGGLVWFTDGSKTGSGTGAGVAGESPRVEMTHKLGHHVTVFQAEVFAIWACAKYNLERAHSGKHIYTCSDSLAALRALHKVEVGSKLVRDCALTLRQLSLNNRVKLLCVPGHAGIPGNEGANEMARLGAISSQPCHEYPMGVSTYVLKGLAKNWLNQEFTRLWHNANGMRHTRALLEGPSQELGGTLTHLDRAQLRMLVSLVTGHWYTRKHLARMGLIEESTCPRCEEEDETPLHVLLRCRELGALRGSILGISEPASLSISAGLVPVLLNFATEAQLPRHSQ
ncbi:uncharacterized protein LOC114881305 [Osmia bicornis bicornis]|uniref:uncharacterized protein LOC114881305 n=1 Tax=Osmia bicornis bicornis TaxID=1437191 RepID=UPI001EAEB4D7|nr:uncharacterized protein LOC114881305 [Osmia bicornis bicornis]